MLCSLCSSQLKFKKPKRRKKVKKQALKVHANALYMYVCVCVCVCVCMHACMHDYKIPKLLLMHVLYIHMQADDLVPLNESSAELLDHGSRFVS